MNVENINVELAAKTIGVGIASDLDRMVAGCRRLVL